VVFKLLKLLLEVTIFKTQASFTKYLERENIIVEGYFANESRYNMELQIIALRVGLYLFPVHNQ